MQNIQLGNVGNIGDIRKHALVAALARRLAGRRATWIDTHAFVLAAPCANPEWEHEVARLAEMHPGFDAYRNAQRRLGGSDRYRCSTAIALEMLRPERSLLAERDPQARELLLGQLASLDFGEVEREITVRIDGAKTSVRSSRFGEISIDYSAAALLARNVASAGPILGLVDPFALDDTLISQLQGAMVRWLRPRLPAAFVLFHYDKQQTAYDWPVLGPLGLPIARLSERPFHVALYASDVLASEARSVANSVGFA